MEKKIMMATHFLCIPVLGFQDFIVHLDLKIPLKTLSDRLKHTCPGIYAGRHKS